MSRPISCPIARDARLFKTLAQARVGQRGWPLPQVLTYQAQARSAYASGDTITFTGAWRPGASATSGTFGIDVDGTWCFGRATITCVAAASLVDNTDLFNLVDQGGVSRQFYYDKTGPGGGTGTAIDISGATTDAQVATATAAAINASGWFTASANAAVVTVKQLTRGATGNRTNTETVANAGFAVTNFTGGADTSAGYEGVIDLSGASAAADVALAIRNGASSRLGQLGNGVVVGDTIYWLPDDPCIRATITQTGTGGIIGRALSRVDAWTRLVPMRSRRMGGFGLIYS